MKKLLSILLAAALMGSLALPAAADDASARLTKVTQAVKNVLDLDTEAYEEFQGECYDEDLAAVWHLRWEEGPNDSSLSIEALEDGTIVSYRFSENKEDEYWSDSLPKFPQNADAAADREIAEAFLKKVLADNETVTLETTRDIERLNGTNSRFSGKIFLNGLPSPLSCSLTVEGGKVIRFDRDTPETTFLGEIPDSKASVDQVKAAAELREKLAVRLAYVYSDSEKKAVLQYLPEKDLHTFYIDALSGETLDITDLEKKMREKGETMAEEENALDALADDAAAPMATAGSGERKMTAAEQAGVEKLAGVLPAEKLDEMLRAEEAYGLKGYTLDSTSYTLQKDYYPIPLNYDGEGEKNQEPESTPVCRLRYICQIKEQGDSAKSVSSYNRTKSRTFTVDARTGEVRNLYSYAPWGLEAKLTEEQAREKADAFLEKFSNGRTTVFEEPGESAYPYKFPDTTPYYRFRFSREVNGYPYAGNYYNISIDTTDGSIYAIDYRWDENLTFDSPEGIIKPETALIAWAETYDVTMEYRLVPRKLDKNNSTEARLIAQGLSSYYGLRLTYGLSLEKYCDGINAKTGEPVYTSQSTYNDEKISYTDVTGHSAQADIEKLARFGVGYSSSEFRPGKMMTQWEFVCLLASVNGQRLNPADATEYDRDNAYDTIYRMGALTRQERSDTSALTRGALVKMLLDAAGYGPAARLKGIYTTSYSDQASIPADSLGYAAIAQALGLAKDTYGASRSASRADAASMLCRILERS